MRDSRFRGNYVDNVAGDFSLLVAYLERLRKVKYIIGQEIKAKKR